jgi:hypothetical protein
MSLPFPSDTLSRRLPLRLLTFFCWMYLLRSPCLRAPGSRRSPDVRQHGYPATRPRSAPCCSRTAGCCCSTQPAPAGSACCWGPRPTSTTAGTAQPAAGAAQQPSHDAGAAPAAAAAGPSMGVGHAGRFGVTYQRRPPPPPAAPAPPRGHYGVVYGRRPRPMVIHGPQPTSRVSGTIDSLQPPAPPSSPMQGPLPPIRLGPLHHPRRILC